jgi:hypothetical protein
MRPNLTLKLTAETVIKNGNFCRIGILNLLRIVGSAKPKNEDVKIKTIGARD